MTERLLVTSVKDPSIYDHVHRVLGHPGEEGMQWHREHTTGANYTKIDAARPPLCRACVEGTIRQTATDHRRTHRVPSGVAGSQFTLDAYSHTGDSDTVTYSLTSTLEHPTRSLLRTEAQRSCVYAPVHSSTPTLNGGVRGVTSIDSFEWTLSFHTSRSSSCSTLASTDTE
jgi:hypothetical protein